MKRISKILSVCMVIAMIFSLAIVPVSAEDLDNAALKLSFEDTAGNAISSAKAGEFVDLYVSLKCDAYVQTISYYLNYNTEYVKHVRQNATSDRTPSTANAGQWQGDFLNNSQVMLEDENDPLFIIDDENEGYGYYYMWGVGEKACTPYDSTTMPAPALATTQLVKVVYTSKFSDQTLLVNTHGEYCKMIRMRFLVQKDVTFDDSIFFFDNNLEPVIVNIDSENVPFSVLAQNAAKNLNVAFEYAEAPVVTSPVYWVKNQIQWNNKEAQSVNLGIVAGFDVADIPISFTDGVSTNVKEVGAKYYLNNVLQDNLTTTRVYKAKGGEAYYFRIVLGNISTTTTDTYKIVPYVVYNNGTEDVTYEAPEVEIKPADVARYVTVLPQ